MTVSYEDDVLPTSGSLATFDAVWNWSGSVGAGLTLVAGDTSGKWTDASISATITQMGSMFLYEYTYANFNKAISHVTLDVSPAIDFDDLLDPAGTPNSNPVITNSDGSVVVYAPEADPTDGPADLDGISSAVKFDSWDDVNEGLSQTVRFKVGVVPVYGHQLIKGGRGLVVFNDALALQRKVYSSCGRVCLDRFAAAFLS